MLTNPQVGQRVKRCMEYENYHLWSGDGIGTIVEIGYRRRDGSLRHYPIVVRWDGSDSSYYVYSLDELECIDPPDPDALLKLQDQQRRQAHADKYL